MPKYLIKTELREHRQSKLFLVQSYLRSCEWQA